MFAMCNDVWVALRSALRRRQPVQERSKKRVDRILSAAMELVETGGGDAVTTRAIAERAGVPVATVYQFFPNREAILTELLVDHLNQRDAEGVAALAAMTSPTLAEAVHGIFEFHRDYLRDHPQLVTLFYTARSTGLVSDPEGIRARFAGQVHAALLEWELLRPDTDPLVAFVAVELGERALELAFRAGPERYQNVLAEAERAIIAYLQTYAVTAG